MLRREFLNSVALIGSAFGIPARVTHGDAGGSKEVRLTARCILLQTLHVAGFQYHEGERFVAMSWIAGKRESLGADNDGYSL